MSFNNKGYKLPRSKTPKKSLELLDIAAFSLALWFVYSVVNNARDLIENSIKNAPASYALILSLVIIGSTFYKRKLKFSTWSIVTLTVLGTAAVIWLLGLSASTQRSDECQKNLKVVYSVCIGLDKASKQ